VEEVFQVFQMAIEAMLLDFGKHFQLIVLCFGVIVAVDAFAPERVVGDIARNLFRAALRTRNLFLAHLRHFHFYDEIFFTFFTGMVVMRHRKSPFVILKLAYVSKNTIISILTQ
jgi:hypothetical protein